MVAASLVRVRPMAGSAADRRRSRQSWADPFPGCRFWS